MKIRFFNNLSKRILLPKNRVCKYAIWGCYFVDSGWDGSGVYMNHYADESINGVISHVYGFDRQHCFFESFLNKQKHPNKCGNCCEKLKESTHVLLAFLMVGFLLKNCWVRASILTGNRPPFFNQWFVSVFPGTAHVSMMPGCCWIGYVNVEV